MGRLYWDFRDQLSLKEVSGERILDVGCGEGITFEKLMKSFPQAQVWGIDIDPANTSICRQHQLPILNGSVYQLPFADGVFDTCLLMEVIEHLDSPGRALSEIGRVIRHGGRLIIVYPVDWAMWLARVMTFRFREAGFDPGHVRQWNRWTLFRLLRKYGFKPLSARGLPMWWPFSLHCLIVAERST